MENLEQTNTETTTVEMYAYTKQQLEDILNAVAALQGTWLETNKVMTMLRSAQSVTVKQPAVAAVAPEQAAS